MICEDREGAALVNAAFMAMPPPTAPCSGDRPPTHLDLHGAGCRGSDLHLHPVGDACVLGGATRQHSVAVQVLGGYRYHIL